MKCNKCNQTMKKRVPSGSPFFDDLCNDCVREAIAILRIKRDKAMEELAKTGGLYAQATLRDVFAGMALEGFCAADKPDSDMPTGKAARFSQNAYRLADAMLAARKGETEA